MAETETWIERTATALHGLSGSTQEEFRDALRAALEAAGELRAVRCKILLGRVLEILREHDVTSGEDGCNIGIVGGLIEEIEEAIR
jgi:hypothetical protein